MTHSPTSDPHAALAELTRRPAFTQMLDALRVPRVLDDATAIQQIPAPTFDEARRAAFVAERFRADGLHDVTTDALHNVFARWPGTDADAAALLLSAHTDTVFPAETDLTLRHETARLHGPGLGDNSLGVAGILAVIAAWQAADYRPPVDVWFVANTREEGLGNLGGIRAVWERIGSRLGAAVVVEGMVLGRIYHGGIAVRRLHITCHAPGGHSWAHFGEPSAVHGLVQLGARIAALQPPRHPRTTFNIGLIHGGQSVNSIASSAELYLDLRSEQPDALARMEQQVRQDVAELGQPRLTFDVEVVGDRPAGSLDRAHPLVQLAAAALERVGREPSFDTGSTDANVLLANGLPTVTVGLTTGGNAHRLDEYIDTPPLADGIRHLALLATAAAEQLTGWR